MDASLGLRYQFGRNWQRFVHNNLTDERVAIAQKHLLGFLDQVDLSGRNILDIGCGSGIHSLAALRAGADEVVSFDYDPDSVAATTELWRAEGSPTRWTILRGDVLDPQFLASQGAFEIVYSWGVLHHTGDVWRAFENAQACIAPGGLFYLALYSADVYGDTVGYWLDTKRSYSAAGPFKRLGMEAAYIWRHVLHGRLRNTADGIRYFRDYKRSRGMSAMTDIRDWLGGWPMQFVRDQEVIDSATRNGLTLAKIKAGEANTEFLFQSAPTN